MSKLLLDETPVIVLPSLVRVLGGIPEAILVQQVHYRAQNGREHDGHRWAVETREQWSEACCLTEKQLRRALAETVKMGVLARFTPRHRIESTAWTRVDYDTLDLLVGGPTVGPKGPGGSGRKGPTQRRAERAHSKEEGWRSRTGAEKAPGGARRYQIPEGDEEPW